MNNYNANSIESLDYFEHIRKYPGMYIGSKNQRGLHHCVKEIISNSIDEWLNGSGNKIIININNKEHYAEVIDNARGIPHGKHKNGMTLLSACFGIANTGGKFNNATGESGYNSSGGEHGTGGKAVNALSTKLIVTSSREGIKDISTFSKGKLLSETTEKVNKNITGTTVKFYPDESIFETIIFDEKIIGEMIEEFSYLCKGLIFEFNGKTYMSKNGLYDYLDFLNKGKIQICSPMYFEEKEGSFQLEAAFVYNNSFSSVVKLYTNNIPQEKGTHLTGFKTAFTGYLNTFAREKKWLKEKDSNLTGSDYEEGLSLIINFKMIDPVFMGQNKEELSSSEGRTYTQKLTTIALKYLFEQHEKDIKIIVDKAITARKAAEAAKRAREATREGDKKKKEKIVVRDSKLADCSSTDRSQCEIFLTEGDSASGNLKVARNKEFQAIMPLRGKVLNVQKAGVDKIKNNAEIMNIIDSLGLEINMKTLSLDYNESRLRYGKIILEADADSDGAHIQALLLTLFWTHCRQLVVDGHVYIGVPPLYRIINSKNEVEYCNNDEELEQYKKTHAGKKFAVKHLKGLGEMNEKDTDILVNPDRRTLYQVTVNNIESANRLFNDLMGTGTMARKAFIENYNKEIANGQ